MSRGIVLGGCEAWHCYNHLVAIREGANTLKMVNWKKKKSTVSYLLSILFLAPQRIQTGYFHFIEEEKEAQRV